LTFVTCSHARASAAALLLALAACQGGARADIVAFGRIWTGDSAMPWASAVATRGDTIIAVGDSTTVASLIGPKTEVLSNGVELITPGFMDNHVHLLSAGYQLSSVDLRTADSPEEFVLRLKAFASERQPGEWIIGGDWDHERWPGAPLPRRDWIDSVTPNNPVLLSRLDGHMLVANGLAMRAAGISKATKDIPGGTIVRDAKTGEPTGVFKDEAMGPLYGAVPATTPTQDDAAIARAFSYASSRGVTAVGAVSSPWNEVAAVKRAHAKGTQTVRVTLFPALADWRRVADTVTAHGPGDDWVRLAGVKGFMDGSLGSTTAFFFDPYLDEPKTSGFLTTPEADMRAQVGAADSAGLQVVVHAIGERANALLLDIFDSTARAHGPRDRRFRIEHAQHLRPAEVQRMAQQGVIASMQPYHAIDDGRWAAKRLGPRVVNSYVFKSLLDAGAVVTFGSDWTVAPIDPLLGIFAAVTRRTLDGRNPDGWLPEQKISVEQALQAYTSANAFAVFADSVRGRIKVGYRADLVLLGQDLFRIPPPTIETVQVRATIAGGKVVYQRPASR
jgi:predicted amidohydrolase YtcJ